MSGRWWFARAVVFDNVFADTAEEAIRELTHQLTDAGFDVSELHPATATEYTRARPAGAA